MSFDPGQISSSNPRLRFQDTGLEFDDAAGAISAARARDGDEVVVGYVNETGQMKYALVDARTEGSHSKQVAHFDPGQLQFGEQTSAVTAFTVDDRNNFDFIRIRPPAAASDAVQQGDAALSLARAATQKEAGRDGMVRSATPGFRMEHSNLDWGRMVRDNKVVVLDHVVQSMAQLDTAQAEVLQQLQTARAQHGPDVAALEQRLAQIQAQRSELDVHRTMLQAELLTSAVDRNVTVPGTSGSNGAAQTVGAQRNHFPRAIAPLRERLAQVERDLQATTDPTARTSLEAQATSLRQTITHLDQTRVGVQEAALHQGNRDMALAQIGGALAEANRDLTSRQAVLADLERQAQAIQSSDRPYAERTAALTELQTRITAQRTAIDAGLARLISTMESQIGVYAANSGQGRVPQAAVALLRHEVERLKELQSGGGGLQDLMQKVTGALDVIQSEHDRLVQVVSAGARNWDGISPNEGLELLRIDGDVQSYRQAYRSAQAQVAMASRTAEIPPESHELSVPLRDQGEWNSCGTTSLAMVLDYMNQYHPTSENARSVETIDAAIRPNSRGHGVIDSFTAPNDIEDYVRAQGLHARQTNDATTDDLKHMIDQGIPPIILTDWEPDGTPSGDSLHYVVVTGYRVDDNGETQWLINNPQGTAETLSNDQLMKVWTDLHYNVGSPIGNIDTGINRLMITVTPPSGIVRNANRDRIPVEQLQLPPRREPDIGMLIEIANEGAGLINDGAEVVHDIKEGVKDAVNTIIDDPLSIIASPLGVGVRLLDL
jgi:hypothetical protein